MASSFLERFLTDPEPVLYATGSREPVRRVNDIVVAMSTNQGMLSADLNNRSLPIRLAPTGNVEDRRSPIGDPKNEYLPANRMRIEAETFGMIVRWVAAGRPLDTSVRHPFCKWAQTIGGILTVSGYTGFLGNYAQRKSVDDPRRWAMGLLGAARPGAWQPPSCWSKLAVDLGLAKYLIPEGDRDTERGRQRGIGVALSTHVGETFHAETENERLAMTLVRARRRFDRSVPSTRYCFNVLAREELPCDPEA
jgi:hypothetical protein